MIIPGEIREGRKRRSKRVTSSVERLGMASEEEAAAFYASEEDSEVEFLTSVEESAHKRNSKKLNVEPGLPPSNDSGVEGRLSSSSARSVEEGLAGSASFGYEVGSLPAEEKFKSKVDAVLLLNILKVRLKQSRVELESSKQRLEAGGWRL